MCVERNDNDVSLLNLGNYFTLGIVQKVGDKLGNGPKENLLNLVKDPEKGLNV